MIAIALAATMPLAGCAVGPNYEPPKTEMVEAWSVQGEGGIQPQPIQAIAWWRTLNDPVLDGLIAQAVQSNHDFRIAQARVLEARAQRRVVAADRTPFVDASASYARSRRSENVGTDSFVDSGGGSFGPGGEDTDIYQAGFDADWELDFFGRVRRSVEAADAEVEAAIEDRRDVLVILLSDVARNYAQLRSLQRRIDIAQQNILTQKETLAISQSRFDAGLVSELDVAQARAQLATTQSQIPALETLLQQTMHSLGVLLGQPPTALTAELASPAPPPGAPLDVPVGLPSDLLRRRPDIRSAERQLAAATARIGVATADLFPRFFLTGSIGLAADDASMLFNSSSATYAFGPSMNWPVFSGGRIRGNIAVQNARQEQALASYERTVLNSLAEVEDALVAHWKQQVRRASLMQAVQANQRSLELAQELYTRGIGDFLNVLESQRALYFSQDQLAQSEEEVTVSYIALYKALGGGWEAYEPEMAAAEGASAQERG